MTTFSHKIAWCSPSRFEWTAKRKGTDSKSSDAGFWYEILCLGFAICNLRTRRGLTARSGTEGSNPLPSAMQSGLQRNSAFSPSKIRERCPFFAKCVSKRDCRERTEVAALAINFGSFSEPASSSPISQVGTGES